MKELLGLEEDFYVEAITDPLPRTFPYQGRIRSSDINIDGFPDLLLTLTIKKQTDNTSRTQSYVLLNRPCLPSQE